MRMQIAFLLFLSVLVTSDSVLVSSDQKPSIDKLFEATPLFLRKKADYEGGPFVFAVIGECKDSCASGGSRIAKHIDKNYPDIAFAVTMGDLISYQGPASDWDDLAANIGGFMDRYATFPVLGDQERMGRPEEKYYQFYNLPRVFRPDNSTWSLGNTVFLMLSYYDPPNFDGGRYTTPSASVYEIETGKMTTVAEVLTEAKATGKNVITFSHAQYLDPAGSPGHKYYCCYNGQTREMFEASSIRLHFQSDNPGLTTMESNGIHYVRASGAWSYDPAFFALVTVDGKSITVEFPKIKGGFQGPPVRIS